MVVSEPYRDGIRREAIGVLLLQHAFAFAYLSLCSRKWIERPNLAGSGLCSEPVVFLVGCFARRHSNFLHSHIVRGIDDSNDCAMQCEGMRGEE